MDCSLFPLGASHCMGNKLKKLKRVVILLSINIVIIVPLLYGFEYYLRSTDPELQLAINGLFEGKLYTWGHLVVNNKYGFRERDFDAPKPKGACRIMVLGDSFTWGAGLSVRERYTNVLEDQLKSKYPQANIEVLNFGMPGGPTTRQRNILRKYRGLVKPDLIVVGFCLNDTQPKSQYYSVERERFDKKYGPSLNSVSRTLSYIGLVCTGRRIEKAVYRLAEIAGTIPRWQVALQRTYEETSKEWVEFVQALKDIKVMSDEMKLPPPIFAVLNQGTSTDRPTDYNNPDEELKLYLQWYHQAEKAASELGFTAYGHEKEIASELSNEILAVNVVDVHPSKELNQLYAKKLFDLIEHYATSGKIKIVP